MDAAFHCSTHGVVRVSLALEQECVKLRQERDELLLRLESVGTEVRWAKAYITKLEHERNITRDVLRLFADLECKERYQGDQCASFVSFGVPCRECLAIEVLKEAHQ